MELLKQHVKYTFNVQFGGSVSWGIIAKHMKFCVEIKLYKREILLTYVIWGSDSGNCVD